MSNIERYLPLVVEEGDDDEDEEKETSLMNISMKINILMLEI